MPSSDSRPAASALPPGIALYQLAIGHYVSRALALVTRLGVADRLETPLPAADLARATGTHAPSLRRVLRLLVSVGVFEEDEAGRFALTPLGTLLREDAPGSMKALVTLFAGVEIQDSWRELEYCVRSDWDDARELFEASGFELTRILPTPARVAVIEGSPR